MSRYRHGIFENLISIAVALAIILVCLLGWFLAKYWLDLFIIIAAGFLLVFAVAIVYDFRYGPIFEKSLTGFVPQSAPIAASSIVSGWVTYRAFLPENVDGRLEETTIILLFAMLLVLASIFNFSEGVYPLRDCPAGQRKKFRNARLKLTLNLTLVHGAAAFLIGYAISSCMG